MTSQLRNGVRLWTLLLVATTGGIARAEPAKRPVNGERRDVDGVPVLRVWGSPREQGYAQGYLLAPQAIKLLDAYLRDQGGEDAIKAYEVTSFMVLQRMKIPWAYQEELEGIIEGGKERLKDALTVPALGRALEYRDLVAINCIPDTSRMGCSSFAAWGPLTTDGQTLAGRNLDWMHYGAMDGQQIVVVRVPPEGDSRLAWVSVGWPCFIGCLTGMNAEGVTVSIHDAPSGPTTDPSRLTPRALTLREALESAHSATAIDDVARVLRKHTAVCGNNVPISFPFDGKHAPAAVFEYDGDLERDGGVTTRLGDPTSGALTNLLACTNHYRRRGRATSCDRYEKIDQYLRTMSKDGKKAGVSEAWQILKDIAMKGRFLTYHSVVFEPDQHKMHIAFSRGNVPAPNHPPITLDVRSLILASQAARR